MKHLLLNRRLLIGITIIALFLVGLKMRNTNVFDSIIPSKKGVQIKETVFIQVAKQFALTLPEKWSVTETTNGKQTIIYPTGTAVRRRLIELPPADEAVGEGVFGFGPEMNGGLDS